MCKELQAYIQTQTADSYPLVLGDPQPHASRPDTTRQSVLSSASVLFLLDPSRLMCMPSLALNPSDF